MAELPMLTAHELQDRLVRGDCSSVEIVQELLAAIQEVDGTIRGYLSVDAEAALAQARAADAARATGRGGPLLGIPVAIKDVLNVAGQPCGCASKMLRGYVAPYDATAVAALRAAGAVLLGRTNMDEFAMGSTTENSAFQVTRNPWSLEHVPGGSSGGSAAVVAAGEAVAALGSDTGGSIRQPAGFCGCVGLKPSYGRVSRYGLTAFASSLDQIGPMTRDVRDAARLLGVMAGHDPHDSTSLPAPVEDYEAGLPVSGGLRGMRLGMPREYFGGGLDTEVEAAVSAAVEECRRQGAEVVEISLPHTRYAIATYYIVACAEASANLSRFDGVRYGHRTAVAGDATELYLRSRAEGFGAEVKRRILLGTYVLSSGYHDAYYLRAQKVRTLIRRDFDAAFERCAAIVCPVAPTAAYRLGATGGDPLKMYLGDVFTVTANLAGLCGLALPCGFTAAGLPVGLQFLGPALGEARVLRAGRAYEQATAWHTRRAPHAAGMARTEAGGK